MPFPPVGLGCSSVRRLATCSQRCVAETSATDTELQLFIFLSVVFDAMLPSSPVELHFQFGPCQQLVHDLIPRNHAFQASVRDNRQLVNVFTSDNFKGLG